VRNTPHKSGHLQAPQQDNRRAALANARRQNGLGLRHIADNYASPALQETAPPSSARQLRSTMRNQHQHLPSPRADTASKRSSRSRERVSPGDSKKPRTESAPNTKGTWRTTRFCDL
jgi:hypothetical protein